MRACVQRVSRATVTINDDTPSEESSPKRSINRGFVILLGVGQDDEKAQAEKLWSKISKLRIFEDECGKTNLSLADIEGEVMIVSQFTLYADCKKGNRPSFTKAGNPEKAKQLYQYFLDLARHDLSVVAHGEFGAMMSIQLCNEGPFTIWLDTDQL